MEPEKAKRAIIITIVTAIILLAACVVILFSDQIFHRNQPEKEIPVEEVTKTPEPTVEIIPTPVEEATETPEPTAEVSPIPDPTAEPVPGPEALKGCSDSLQYPKEESYLKSFVSMITRANNSNKVYLLYRPEKLVNSFDVMLTLDDGIPVTAIAKENGFTLVLLKDGVAGWIPTHDLEEH